VPSRAALAVRRRGRIGGHRSDSVKGVFVKRFFLSAAWICALLLVTALPRAGRAQIVNTLVGFDEEEPGWSGGVEARFSLTGGNTELVSLSGGGHVQYQSGANRWRLLGDATRETSQGERVEESTVAHLRHNRRLLPWLSTLTFIQHQRNPFQRLTSRFLAGAGARFDVVRASRIYGALGASHMVEVERIEDTSGTDTDQRLSVFAILEGKLSEAAAVEVTSFVQPRWGDFTDMRSILAATLRVTLVGSLAMTLDYDLQHDTEPPAGVEATDWKLRAGFAYGL
jgi:putative salt-induced outer membrane protein